MLTTIVSFIGIKGVIVGIGCIIGACAIRAMSNSIPISNNEIRDFMNDMRENTRK